MVTRQASENAWGVITMMLYDMTAQYQAGRIKSASEQRRADDQLGTMAAEVSRLWQRITRPAQALRGFRARRARTAYPC
jgi:hypothetical protein